SALSRQERTLRMPASVLIGSFMPQVPLGARTIRSAAQ
ncbi:MAG: hypothetical protein H6Q07_227, partial [Acidobacteria bacterium]|nr:hypothetical protein [Acidobacteriota bacterium]